MNSALLAPSTSVPSSTPVTMSTAATQNRATQNRAAQNRATHKDLTSHPISTSEVKTTPKYSVTTPTPNDKLTNHSTRPVTVSTPVQDKPASVTSTPPEVPSDPDSGIINNHCVNEDTSGDAYNDVPALEDPTNDYDYKVPITPMISHINYITQYRAKPKHYFRVALLWRLRPLDKMKNLVKRNLMRRNLMRRNQMRIMICHYWKTP